GTHNGGGYRRADAMAERFAGMNGASLGPKLGMRAVFHGRNYSLSDGSAATTKLASRAFR
ncbi:MAG: hypothetical protein WBL63_13595, partial [Candidatus Acidiferrum sp.]